MKKYASGSVLSANAELGWAGVALFAKLMQHSNSFTGGAVTAAADQVTEPITGGLFGPWVGSGKSPLTDLPRLYNYSFVPTVIANDNLQATSGFTPAW
jgi:hypothetical protein